MLYLHFVVFAKRNLCLSCQEIFLNEMTVKPEIARNQALKENAFMMAICIQIGIPLFLVGKPGSSKSLAKTIVTSAMQGLDSTSILFKRMKTVIMSLRFRLRL